MHMQNPATPALLDQQYHHLHHLPGQNSYSVVQQDKRLLLLQKLTSASEDRDTLKFSVQNRDEIVSLCTLQVVHWIEDKEWEPTTTMLQETLDVFAIVTVG